MTTFDVNAIKTNFMNSIRTYVYPYQDSHTSSISLNSSGGIINQELYLFSTSISTYGIYVSGITGTPGGLTLSLYNRGTLIDSNIIAGTIGWNLVNCDLTELSSSRASTLVIAGSVNAGNDYLIGKDSTATYYYSTLSTLAVAFTIGIKDFVYKVFPLTEYNANNFPLVVVDIYGRPRIINKYLTGDMSWFDVTVRADIYSKYTQELDKLAYGIDRGIFYNRKDFLSTYFITPAAISEITYIKPEVYTRYISWTIKQLITRE